ncbi:MAG: IS21-like element helper ATPase IstB [Acidimicrobiales bacterium]
MLANTTIEGLRTLHLNAMAQGLLEQRERLDYAELSFEERLGLLVDRELLTRDNRRLERLLKAAKLKLPAAIEELDYSRPRGLDRHVVLALATSAWVAQHQVVLVVGPTGVGKTFLACALAQSAIRNGHSALYLRAPRMFDELAIARGDGRLARLTASWARIDVLVIDDFLLRPLSADQAADLLEIVEDRAQHRSTILTSQLPVGNWHEALGDPTIADAVLDRLLERANRLELIGDSMRRRDAGSKPRAEK